MRVSWFRELCRAAALLLSVSATGAYAQGAGYRCIIGGYKQDLKFEGDAWYLRGGGKGWGPLGCGTAKEAPRERIECSRDNGQYVATITTSFDDGSGSVRRLTFDPKALSYSSTSPNSSPAQGDCAVLATDSARPEDAWSLSRKLAAGLPFLLVSTREMLNLRPGKWEYPRGYWVILEGKYHPDSGTWAANGVGFDPGATNSYHSCPPSRMRPAYLPACGGVHQAGFTMDRWYKPQELSLVIFGRVLQFDESGTVRAEGKTIGRLMVPDL